MLAFFFLLRAVFPVQMYFVLWRTGWRTECAPRAQV
jgi:hypothetical protein